MRKPFNLRVPVLMAAALCAGIVYSTVLAYFRLSGIYILIPVLIVLAACIPVAIIKGGVSKPLIIIAATVFFSAGAVYLYAKYAAFVNSDVLQNVAVSVSGRVKEVGVTSEGHRYLILSDVTVNGESIKGRVAAYLGETAGDYCRCGYTVNFYTQLEKQNFIGFGAVSYNACRGVNYICTVNGGMQSTYHFDLFGEINYAFERVLFDNLDGETAAVSYALLTGNTDAMSESTITAFRNGGIAHIFAVSGLHIGVIYGVLTFVFKKLIRVNRYVSTAIRIAVICLYSGVCLFSPSSVRALVMCSVSAVAGCFHRKPDGLNALAVAAVILLLINPLYLYSAGFSLSFAAVLGILLLSKNLERLFGFLPEKLAKAASVSLSAQVSVYPVQLTSFGYISAAGLLLNLIFIPVISVLYILLFICACVSVVVPVAAGVLLECATLPIELIINVVIGCGFENALISGEFGYWLYVPFALFYIGVTDRLNIRPFMRSAYTCVFAVLLMFSSFATTLNGYAVVEFNSGYSGGSVTITTGQGTVLVVSENFELRSGCSASADVLIVLGGDDGLTALTALGKNYQRVYMRGGVTPLPCFGDTPVYYSDDFTECGVDFSYRGDKLTATVYGREVSFVANSGTYSAGNSGADFELYCYRSKGAVLQTDEGMYALDVCGAMRYEISAVGYNSSHLIPRE